MNMNATVTVAMTTLSVEGNMYSITNCIIAPDKHMCSYIFNPFN